MQLVRATKGAAAAVGLGVLLLTSCSRTIAPATSDPTPEPAPPRSTTPRPAAETESPLRVPEAVVALHQRAFAPNPAEAELGRVICVVTLHDAAYARGYFHPLVVFADGAITTWTQADDGPREPFTAQLDAEEQASAAALIHAIPGKRAMADERFEAQAHVMGVSTRDGETVVTLYFDVRELPDELSRLVGMLQHRLEATNQPR